MCNQLIAQTALSPVFVPSVVFDIRFRNYDSAVGILAWLAGVNCKQPTFLVVQEYLADSRLAFSID
jgi:hypothetical protein